MGCSQNLPCFPTLIEAWNEDSTPGKDSFKFNFTRISSEVEMDEKGRRIEGTKTMGKASSKPIVAGKYRATFWVTGHAILWEIPPSRALLRDAWRSMTSGTTDPLNEGGDMLVRLPGSAVDNQRLADVITTHPDPLKTGAVDGLIGHRADMEPSMKPEPSLLLTPKLSDLRWLQAKRLLAGDADPNQKRAGAVLRHCNQDTGKPIVGESAKMCVCISKQLNAWRAKSKRFGLPDLAADDGKIWAISNQIGAKRTTKEGVEYRAAVNYGWHVASGFSAASTPGLRVVQPGGGHRSAPNGTAHDKAHIDYSQVCMLVSGWCEVTSPNQNQPSWRKTRDIYTDPALHHLVTNYGPLKVTHYKV